MTAPGAPAPTTGAGTSELAQTNVQLVRQVTESGWADEDLLQVRRAYELAMWAYSGQYRGNGKTQVAHHVGTASALQAAGERPALVVAGLVHSIYELGDLGTGRRGVSPRSVRTCARRSATRSRGSSPGTRASSGARRRSPG